MPIERILLGVDGSDGSNRAAAFAAELAVSTAAEVIAVHAYNPLESLGEVAPPLDFHALREEAERRLAGEWTAPLAEVGITLATRLEEDQPVPALIRVARDEQVDVVVIGSHGRTGWRERVLGSVASGLAGAAPCPVTIVPARGG